MAQQAYRIPEGDLPPLPSSGAHTALVRARNIHGPGIPSAPVAFRPVSSTTARQARINGRWMDISPYALARTLFALTQRTSFDEGEAESEAAKTTVLEVELNLESSARASAIEDLAVSVRENAAGIVAEAARITALMAEVANIATSAAVQALTTRVTAGHLEGTITSLTTLAGKASAAAVSALITTLSRPRSRARPRLPPFPL